MKRLFLAFLFFTLPAFGQLGNVTLQHFPGAPTGACGYNQQAINDATGDLYTCLTGSWHPAGTSTGTGTVTTFSSGSLAPLFSTSVLNPSTTPAQSFTLSNFGAHLFYGNNTGSSAAPGADAVNEADVTNLISDLAAKAPLASPTFTGTITTPITGIIQCLHVSTSGVVTGTGSDCGSGGGAVSSVANSDTTLTISPTTGAVVASLNLGHANTWTANQTFPATSISLATLSGLGTGMATWLGTPTSANLRAAVTDETGTGALFFAGGNAGTPSAINLTNGTALPVAGINATGTPSSSNFLRGDGSWNTPAGGGNVSNSGTPTSGQAAEWVSATAIQGVATAGGGSQYVKATFTSPAQGDQLTFDATPKLVNVKPGVAIDTQSSATPAVASADRVSLVNTTNSTTSTATSVPSAASLGSNFPFVTCNPGSVINTITPTTSTVNGNTAQKLVGQVSGHSPECAFWWSDNTNYFSAEILPTDANGALADEGLPNTGVSAGSCGDATHSCSITVDAKGRITAQSNNVIAGGSTGMSGMTAGQVPIAATASTVTSSKALAGAGASIVTGPATSVNTDLPSYSGTSGQTQDSGILSSNVTQTTATPAANQICVYGSTAKTCTPTTTLPTAAVPAFTGDVTNSSGSLATTVNKISGTSPGTNAVAAFGVSDTTFTNATTAIGANSCSASAVTVTMAGTTTSMAFVISPSTDVSGSTGWGSSGGLVIDAWPTVNTLNYKICNQTAASITPAAVTWNVGVR